VSWNALVAALRRRAAATIVLPLAAAALGFSLSFLFAPKYRVEAVLLPQQADAPQGVLGSLAGQFGGLASLAGVDLGGGSNKVEGVAVLRSRSLAEEFIRSRNLLPVLFPEDWDANKQHWKPMDPEDVPTLGEGIRKLDRHVRAVLEDRRTGLVTLSITWRDAAVAADWANDLVRRANVRMQARAVQEARRTIEFLAQKAAAEGSVSVREALYKIVESQYKSMALASVREDFAFRVIDPAVAPDPDDFAEPRRAVFAAAGAFVGLVLAGFMLLVEARRRVPPGA